jgi:Alkylmercury lyase
MAHWASPEARAVRREVFATFAAEGRPPSPSELADRLTLAPNDVMASLRELHEAHALVLTAIGDGVRMAHPFSAWPMHFVVRGGERLWWGGCAWDSFGIVAALGEELEISTTCPATGRALRYVAGPKTPPDADGVVVRMPRPAAQWWDDVVATCTSIRAFASAADAELWMRETGAGGELVELEQLWRLALPWYGDRLDAEWAPQSRDQRQSLLEQTGLTGDFWALPKDSG